MIEGFVRQRVVRNRLGPQFDRRTHEYMAEVNRVKARAAEKAKAKLIPPEKSLPSPDTDAASASSPGTAGEHVCDVGRPCRDV